MEGVGTSTGPAELLLAVALLIWEEEMRSEAVLPRIEDKASNGTGAVPANQRVGPVSAHREVIDPRQRDGRGEEFKDPVIEAIGDKRMPGRIEGNAGGAAQSLG